MIKHLRSVVVIAAAAGAVACDTIEQALFVSPPPVISKRPQTPNVTLAPVTFAQLPGWKGGRQDEALPVLRRSCAKFAAQPPGRPIGASGIGGRIRDWRGVCDALVWAPLGNPHAARAFLETRFNLFLVGDRSDPAGLFTGYYEAQLRGSWTRYGPYQYPIYAPPRDSVSGNLQKLKPELSGLKIPGRVAADRVIPAYTRREIDGGALRGRGLEILWVDNPIDAFFLHIQGSGRVVMEDGSVARLGFAGRNGYKYVAIGRELIAMGALVRETVSMQSIRSWLERNPRQAAGIMAKNPSYIFFRILRGPGPIGAQGIALTPGRSLAVDKNFIPLGVPLWIDTTQPLDPAEPLRRLVVAQDTGGAIKGPVRGDLYWGHGEQAALKAGFMKQRGRYYILLPKPPVPPG